MTYQWCHGPKCHTNRTQDRIRGVKGNKVLRTRKITENNWNRGNFWSVFCSQGCYTDFFYKYWQQVIAIAPRTEPLETPIEVKQNKREGYEYRLNHNNGQYERVPTTYISKEIIDKPTDDVVG